MADNTYPKIAAKAWVALRARAVAAPTVKFTPDVVAALMGMANPESARGNTVAPMRRLGLIEEDGALTDRGNRWRVDSSFADVCQEILDEVYPDDLAALIDDDGRPDAARVKTWFDHKGFGASNARLMTATYVMIAKKEIPDAPGVDPVKAKPKASRAKKPAGKSSEPTETEHSLEAIAHEPPVSPARANGGPTLHLDIQIHIPADATLDQIDQIFSSMARHLYAK